MVKIAIVMPTLNAERYLVEAITSLQEQSWRDFDLLVLDGGSRDATVDIASCLARGDSRIKISVEDGTSPSSRINGIIAASTHDYLVMAHADDISVRHRLATQISFMQRNPELIMSGSYTHYWYHDKRIGAESHHYSGKGFYPLSPRDITVRLPFWWSFSVPSMILDGNRLRTSNLMFDDTLKTCSDWWLNWELARIGEVANLPAPLLAYRHHHDGHGPREQATIAAETRIVRERIAAAIGLDTHLSASALADFLQLRVEADEVRQPLATGNRLFAELRSFDATAAGLDAKAWIYAVAGYEAQNAALMAIADIARTL